jgi:hypothetical protein
MGRGAKGERRREGGEEPRRKRRWSTLPLLRSAALVPLDKGKTHLHMHTRVKSLRGGTVSAVAVWSGGGGGQKKGGG